MKPKVAWGLLKETVTRWSDDDAMRLAAALAFYTVLSIAPLLVLTVAVAGLVFGADAARGQIASELTSVVGSSAADGIETLLANAKSPGEGVIGSIVGVVVLLFGASNVFRELQVALNNIWDVEPKPGGGIWAFIKARFFSFTMVMGVAFLLLVSLALSAALSAMAGFFPGWLPGGETIWRIANFGISFAVVSLLFALIFKVIPDVKVSWRDVWPGGVFTALLFTIGKFGLGMYLGQASVASPYGAAGSVVVLVIWVYYAAQILFLGAEFTRTLARHRGARIEPSANAVAAPDASPPVVPKGEPEERAEQRLSHV